VTFLGSVFLTFEKFVDATNEPETNIGVMAVHKEIVNKNNHEEYQLNENQINSKLNNNRF